MRKVNKVEFEKMPLEFLSKLSRILLYFIDDTDVIYYYNDKVIHILQLAFQ